MSIHIPKHAFVRPQTQNFLSEPSTTAVAANSTAIFKLRRGLRYHNLYLMMSGGAFTVAHTTEIRVKVNGDVVQRFTGTWRDTMNQFDGLPAYGGSILCIPFERFGLDQGGFDRYLTCLNVGFKSAPQAVHGIHDASIEVDIGGATTPALSLRCEVSDINLDQSVALYRIEKYIEQVVAGSENLFDALYTGDPKRTLLNRLVLEDTVAHITNFRIEVNGTRVIDTTTALNEFMQKMRGRRTPQAGFVVYDPMAQGEYGNVDRLDVRNWLITTTQAAGATANLTVTKETLGTF